MPRFPSAQGRLNHEPDSTLAVTKTCPKDGVHLSGPTHHRERAHVVWGADRPERRLHATRVRGVYQGVRRPGEMTSDEALFASALKRFPREGAASDPKSRRAGHAPKDSAVRWRTLDAVNVDASRRCPRGVSSRPGRLVCALDGTHTSSHKAHSRRIALMAQEGRLFLMTLTSSRVSTSDHRRCVSHV